MKPFEIITTLIVVGIIVTLISIGLHREPSVHPDQAWCEENGGRWIKASYNKHCEWVPDYQTN